MTVRRKYLFEIRLYTGRCDGVEWEKMRAALMKNLNVDSKQFTVTRMPRGSNITDYVFCMNREDPTEAVADGLKIFSNAWREAGVEPIQPQEIMFVKSTNTQSDTNEIPGVNQ